VQQQQHDIGMVQNRWMVACRCQHAPGNSLPQGHAAGAVSSSCPPMSQPSHPPGTSHPQGASRCRLLPPSPPAAATGTVAMLLNPPAMSVSDSCCGSGGNPCCCCCWWRVPPVTVSWLLLPPPLLLVLGARLDKRSTSDSRRVEASRAYCFRKEDPSCSCTARTWCAGVCQGGGRGVGRVKYTGER
jgi:hypothetical protein